MFDGEYSNNIGLIGLNVPIDLDFTNNRANKLYTNYPGYVI
jgi:hypothetical protein